MKTVDFKLIRRQLPHGSIVKIAEQLDLSPRIVSNVLNNGWYTEYRASVLAAAMSIIKSIEGGEELMEQAEELDFISDGPVILPRKPHGNSKKPAAAERSNISFMGVLLLFGLIAAAAFFFIPSVRMKIQSLWSNLTAK